MMIRIARAAVAAVAGLLLLAGPPVLLVWSVGNPWPAEGLVWDAPLPDNALIGLLAAAVWLLWAQFAVCVAVELGAAVRDRPTPAPIPGTFGLQQHLARRLVTAVLAAGVLSTTTVAAPPPALAAPSTTTEPHPTLASPRDSAQTARNPDRPAAHTGPTGPTVLVRAGDTLWALAEQHLGDPTRWRDIAALNEGHQQPDGRVFRHAELILPGWLLRMPADATDLTDPGAGPRTYVVQPGDTLSGIAAHAYGNPGDYRRIADANRDLISDPDLIDPGWRLTLPAAPPRPPDPDSPSPETARHRHPAEQTPPQAPDEDPPMPVSGKARDQLTPPTVASTPRAPVDPPMPVPAVPATADDQATDTSSARSTDDGVNPLALTGAGAVFAAGVLALLIRQRRRQFRTRRPGRAVVSTPDRLQPVEAAVLAGGSTAAADVARFDAALRWLAVDCRATATALPDVVAARLSGDRIDLYLEPEVDATGTEPPAPWTRTSDGTCWSVPSVRVDEQGPAPEVVAPYPLLVTVGTDHDGAVWLLDLEHTGLVAVLGTPSRVEGLLTAMAAELGVNAWSERVDVTMAGFGRPLVRLDPQRLRYTDDPAGTAARLAAAVVNAAGGDALADRRDVHDADVWDPHALFARLPDDQARIVFGSLVDSLQATAGRSTVALVVAGAVGVNEARTVQLSIDEHGRLSIAGLVVDLTAANLPPAEAAEVAALAEHLDAADDDAPMPTETGTAPGAGLRDAAGRLRPELTRPRDGTSPDPASPLPLPDTAYLDASAATEDDLAALAPECGDELRGEVLAADPRLDADLAAWRDGDSRVPKLALLGPVRLDAAGHVSADVARRRAYLVELAAYLATRDHGATAEQVAEAFGIAAPTVYSRLASLRSWLGTDPATGAAYLPDAKQSAQSRTRGIAVYTIEGLLVDADLFRRLRARAQARGADGITDLTAALGLVTGRPFDQLRTGGYRWLAETPIDHYLLAGIVDTAHLAATHQLAAGDAAAARWAVETGLRAAPYDDILKLDLAEVMRHEGRPDAADAYVRDQVANYAEPGETPLDLPDRTATVLHRRGWADPRATRRNTG